MVPASAFQVRVRMRVMMMPPAAMRMRAMAVLVRLVSLALAAGPLHLPARIGARWPGASRGVRQRQGAQDPDERPEPPKRCLLYTSDAADE